MSTHFLVAIDKDTTVLAVKDALRRHGIEAADIRDVTPNHNGYVFTNLLAEGIWEQETGAAHCQQESCNHRAWRELTKEQQNTFTSALAQFLDNCRIEEFQPELNLAGMPSFQDIRLTHCRYED